MPSIGIVSGSIEKGFAGQLITLSIKAPIEVRRNQGKTNDIQPDKTYWRNTMKAPGRWPGAFTT